jgi:hypothetical protein
MRKSSKKKAEIFLLLGILLLGVMPARSQSYLYVYGNDGTKQSFSMESVLTFTGTNLVVTDGVNPPVSVSFTNLRLFSLESYIFTGFSTPDTKTEVSVYPNLAGTDVTVKSAKTITGLGLYNLQGQKLLQIQPESLEVIVPLSAYPAGLYLLQIVDESGVTIKKIIKK